MKLIQAKTVGAEAWGPQEVYVGGMNGVAGRGFTMVPTGNQLRRASWMLTCHCSAFLVQVPYDFLQYLVSSF